MEKYKNITSINEVKEVLSGLQQLYREKNINNIDEYISKRFSTKNGFVVLGSGLEQWCFNNEEVKNLIKSHLDSNSIWKNTDFKFEEARIFATEDVAWVISIGVIKDTIAEEKSYSDTIDKVKEILGKENRSKADALFAAIKMANTLRQTEKGENYVWPFRFTSVLLKENGTWKFHQLQVAFDSESWPYRLKDEAGIKAIFEMPESKSEDKYDDIRKTLQFFQDGYTKRDVNFIDEYMKELFLLNEDLLVIGTDAGELCLGADAARGIIESDWKYWGDFKFNVDDAVINVSGDVAYFTTKAFLKRIVPESKMLEWINGSNQYTFDSEMPAKQKLLMALQDTIDYIYEIEVGETIITPMRFSGVLLKKDGKWLIQHLQYSDYNEGKPEVRIL